MEEVMKTEKLTIEKVLRDAGWIDKWEAKGEERKALNIAKKMVGSGFPPETVAAMTELDPEKVKILYA